MAYYAIDLKVRRRNYVGSELVAAASEEFHGMRKNLAEIRGPENMFERDAGGEKLGISMDRRVSVAPMMDWSDDRNFG